MELLLHDECRQASICGLMDVHQCWSEEEKQVLSMVLLQQRRSHIMSDSQRVHVGGYEAWMENGMLALHYHKGWQSERNQCQDEPG